MSSYNDDDSTGRRGYGDDSGGGYGVRIPSRSSGEDYLSGSLVDTIADDDGGKKGNTTGSSRGDEGYGVEPTTTDRKGSEAGLTSALQSSTGGRGGGMGGDESYGSSGRAGGMSSGLGDDSYNPSGRTGGDDSYGSSGRGDSTFGSGITGGAGSGNKMTSGTYESTGLSSDYGTGHSGDSTDRNEPYSGSREYGSGATGGAGFGNKSSGHRENEPTFDGNADLGRNSDAYNDHREYGSGSTGGAGYGNKSSNRDSDDGPGDSTSGKIMEKVGGMLGNTKMQEKGSAKPRANRDISALVRRFENILEYNAGDRNTAAVNAYKLDVETANLIRAAEDILSLTRVLKEMWLFGKLQTVGMNEAAEERAEASAQGVEEGLRKLVGGGMMNTL
ncbi:MAG: hypothetical protein Q9185_001576 [Variospora sp. 1 TL-2023]